MTFNTSEYEFVHGTKPGGFGFWMFSSDYNDYGNLPFQFEHTGLYGEAKKAASAEFEKYRQRWNMKSFYDVLEVHA